ncbi:protein TFG-like isoform X1 [Haliotis cracherodii]|uniref:protein TFG-like isoform X1 n=1 Tax=Haliotis cracherodii TaxID=6455 RepID=UPI0039ED7E8F
MQNSLDPQLDLSGKLIIKVQLGEDIRRIPIHNEDITYDELLVMMQRVYRGKFNSNDDIIVKYKDEDGDLITIFDSSDLSFAIQCSRILKITLFVNGQPKPLETDEVKLLRKELQQIRDRVNRILDRLEPTPAPSSTCDTLDGSGLGPSPSKKGTPGGGGFQRPAQVASSKEFDPLSSQRSVEESTQNKVMSSFGITSDSTNDRPGTPDSISSVGSSASNQYKRQQQGTPTQPSTPQQQPTPSPQSFPQQPPQQAFPGQPGYQQPPTSQQPQAGAQFAGQPGTFPGQTQGQQQPQTQQPGYQQPGHQQPGHQQPGHQQPGPAGYAQYQQGQQGYNPPQPQPGQPQPSQSQPGQPQPGQPQASQAQPHPGQPQPGQPQPGQPQPGQPGYGAPQSAPYGLSGQQPQPGQQQMYGQQQQGYQQGQHPQQFNAPASGPGPAGGANPYRGGYASGYPRPQGGYTQGYQ